MNDQDYQSLLGALNCIGDPTTDPNVRSQAELFIESFKESENAMDYILYILGNINEAHTDYVKFVSLNCLKSIIISKWHIFNPNRKAEAKDFVIYFMKNFINDNISHGLFVISKFAEVFVELMKREWPQRWESVYDELKNCMRQSGSQFYTGVLIFEYLLQDINDKSVDSRLTDNRRADLRGGFNRDDGSFIQFITYTLDMWEKNHSSGKELVINCIMLFTALVPSLTEEILKAHFSNIVSVFSNYLNNPNYCNELLPEYLQFFGNLTKKEYSMKNRDFAIKVAQTLLGIFPSIQTLFPDIESDYEIYKHYYLAIIDFCMCQRHVFSSWKTMESEFYRSIIHQVLPMIVVPCLEISDFALDALPLLYPDCSKPEFRSIRDIANDSICVLIQNILVSMQGNNINNPQFNEMNYRDYDAEDAEDYKNDYGDFVSSVISRIVEITPYYHGALINAILTILNTQWSTDPLFVNSMLIIVGAINQGIQRKEDFAIHAENTKNGSTIIEQFMSFPLGANFQDDMNTFNFIFNFTWVLKNNTVILTKVMEYLMNTINSIPTYYESNVDAQEKVCNLVSQHLMKICYFYGKNLLTQYNHFLQPLTQLISSNPFSTTVSNLSICYIHLLANNTIKDQRCQEYRGLLQRYIDYLTNQDFVAVISNPDSFHSTFSGNISEFCRLCDNVHFVTSMLDELMTSEEYLEMVRDVYSAINQTVTFLLQTAAQLLCSINDSEKYIWSVITTVEIGSIQTKNPSPIQSTRLHTLFLDLTKMWRHFANFSEIVNDNLIDSFTNFIQQTYPLFRFSMINAVNSNIVLPLYLSYAPSWSSRNQQVLLSNNLVSLLLTAISATYARLQQGEYTQSLQYLGIILPNQSDESALQLGSEMISEDLVTSCGNNLIELLNGLIGLSFKEYRQTYAVNAFANSLISSSYGGYGRRNQTVTTKSMKPLKATEETKSKCIEYFRPIFEGYVVNQVNTCNCINEIIAMIIPITSSSLPKNILTFCNIYIPYLGGRRNYANFLDTLFQVSANCIINNEIQDDIWNKRLLTICTYIYGFNILKKNLSIIRVNSRDNITSTILQYLDATGLTTTQHLEYFKNRMLTARTLKEGMDILNEFFIDMKNTVEGNETKIKKLETMIEVPKAAINKKGKKGKDKRRGNDNYNNRGRNDQSKNNRKNRRKQQKYQQKNRDNIWGDDKVEDDWKEMTSWN